MGARAIITIATPSIRFMQLLFHLTILSDHPSEPLQLSLLPRAP
jgi:hypothetical protein